ncbi:MAG: hypothetical protein GY859_09765 [Desulfobacterales bacterium]|nr:hypothetical protein [Desulfobacterales bacterium]
MAAIQFTGDMIAPSHMTRKDIPRGRYARFTHTGDMRHLKSTIYHIYKRTLPGQNLRPESRGKAGLIHFERYDNRFRWSRPDSIIEVYVPLETGV